jgi:hypothetical protein
MFKTSPPDIKLEQLIEIFDELDELLQDYLLLQAREILKIKKTRADPKQAQS